MATVPKLNLRSIGIIPNKANQTQTRPPAAPSDSGSSKHVKVASVRTSSVSSSIAIVKPPAPVAPKPPTPLPAKAPATPMAVKPAPKPSTPAALVVGRQTSAPVMMVKSIRGDPPPRARNPIIHAPLSSSSSSNRPVREAGDCLPNSSNDTSIYSQCSYGAHAPSGVDIGAKGPATAFKTRHGVETQSAKPFVRSHVDHHNRRIKDAKSSVDSKPPIAMTMGTKSRVKQKTVTTKLPFSETMYESKIQPQQQDDNWATRVSKLNVRKSQATPIKSEIPIDMMNTTTDPSLSLGATVTVSAAAWAEPTTTEIPATTMAEDQDEEFIETNVTTTLQDDTNNDYHHNDDDFEVDGEDEHDGHFGRTDDGRDKNEGVDNEGDNEEDDNNEHNESPQVAASETFEKISEVEVTLGDFMTGEEEDGQIESQGHDDAAVANAAPETSHSTSALDETVAAPIPKKSLVASDSAKVEAAMPVSSSLPKQPLKLSKSRMIKEESVVSVQPQPQPQRTMSPPLYRLTKEPAPIPPSPPVDAEMAFLDFTAEVTQDILDNAVSSDSAVNALFEKHIERRKGELDEAEMRRIVSQIRTDLGIAEPSL